MKAAAIAGIVLIAIGIYVVVGQASYKSDKEVLKIGGLAASVQDRCGPAMGRGDRDRGRGRAGVCRVPGREAVRA